MEEQSNPYASPSAHETSPIDRAQPASSSRRLAHVPPLSIGYLLLVTAVTAATLTLTMQMLLPLGDDAVVMILMVAAILLGWTCSATLLVAWHAIKRTLWRLEPGECVVLGLTNAVVLSLVIEWMLRTIVRVFGSTGVPHPHPARLAQPAAIAAVFLVAAVAHRRRPNWCAALTGGAVLCLSPYAVIGRLVASQEFVGVVWLMVIIVLMLLGAAIIDDWRGRELRHWMHWSGVGISATVLFGMLMLTTLALVLRW